MKNLWSIYGNSCKKTRPLQLYARSNHSLFCLAKAQRRKGHTRLQGLCLAPVIKQCSTAYSTIRMSLA